MKVIIENQNFQGAFNLANAESEALSLEKFLIHIDKNIGHYQFLDQNNGEGIARAFYPSVDNGYINTELIRNQGV